MARSEGFQDVQPHSQAGLGHCSVPGSSARLQQHSRLGSSRVRGEQGHNVLGDARRYAARQGQVCERLCKAHKRWTRSRKMLTVWGEACLTERWEDLSALQICESCMLKHHWSSRGWAPAAGGSAELLGASAASAAAGCTERARLRKLSTSCLRSCKASKA